MHTVTTENGTNKCNKAIFRIYSDNKFEMEFNWDSIWQAEVDKNNEEAKLEDATCQIPKWQWEK